VARALTRVLEDEGVRAWVLTAVPLARGGRSCVLSCCVPRRAIAASPVGLRCVAVRYHEQQPTFIPPMLLTSGTLPSGDAWTFEIKWDGCRAQLRYDGRSVSLRTRNGRECAADFPELAAIASVLGKRRVTLDGELVCLRSDGRPDFGQLRHRLTGSAAHRRPAMLQAFDLLHLDGNSTRALPYVERRSLLEELALDGPDWRTPASVVVERSEDFVARVEELGLEGVVAKRLSSTYLPGRRCNSWIKNKLRRDERLAVTGIRRTRAGHVEAIFVARHQPDGSLTGAGSIELGLHRELIERLEDRLEELPPRRRGVIAWYPAEVSVVASVHGLHDGPVRDAILRQVIDV
jgi:bifunctional non-homologous end joining protein LigD